MSNAAGFDGCLFIVEKYLKAVTRSVSQPVARKFRKIVIFLNSVATC